MLPIVSFLFSAIFTIFITLFRPIAVELIPDELRSYLSSRLHHFFTSSEQTFIIDKKCAYTINQVYEAADVYLQSKISPLNNYLKVSKRPGQHALSIAIDRDEEIIDTFDNITLKWLYKYIKTESKGGEVKEKPRFELKFPKKHKTKVIDLYLPHVLARAEELRRQQKVLRLDSQDSESIDFEHPSTFDKLAIDPEIKSMIIDDLKRFLGRKAFYDQVGKAWKRGYLLFGPPGTGKSSLIAAMANFLKFDVFDVELSSISNNSELRTIILSTSNRSILVIEDIDCTIAAQNREKEFNQQSSTKVTLSGLLNSIDGLWSSCGDGRIIVFTTNNKDKLDPALLRPGRMDVHIHMSYLTASGFRILASNYLDIHESNRHCLCGEIEKLIASLEVTPAEVAEELMKSADADVALEGLVNFLKNKELEVESNSTKDEGTNKSEIEETN